MVYRLGFYWDDWPSVWFYHLWGAESFFEGFAEDRPLLAWVFMLTTSLLGESTWAWQLFGIFTRWLTAVTLWWMIIGLWPGNYRMAFLSAALFLLYPGFSQQYIAVTYSNGFLVFALFIFSLGAMVWAYRTPSRFWPLIVLSLIASALSMLITEYFFGLELLRPLFLWIIDENRSKRERLRKVFIHWLPYLFLVIPFLIWRVFFSTSPRGQLIFFEEFSSSPFTTLLNLTKTIFQDFFEVNFLAWFHYLDLSYLKDFEANVILLMVGSILAGVLFTAGYINWTKVKQTNEQSQQKDLHRLQAWQAVLIGLAAFLISGWVIWLTDLHIELLFPFDRFTLITMLGTVFLIAGIIALVSRSVYVEALLLCLLIGLAIASQFQHRLLYRQEWLSQKSFFWQLVWRAPGIRPGTTLLTSEIPFTYYTDNSLTAPLNWIYSPQNKSKNMDFLLYDIEARLGRNLPVLSLNIPIHAGYRAASFDGSTSQAIVLFYDPPRCLKVMIPDQDRFLPVKPLYIKEATPLSDPGLILAEEPSAIPPAHILGPEPTHNWCYYFQKAELYAQRNEWDLVSQMADKALIINKHFTEKNVSELIPFVMGYAHTGQWEKAVDLSNDAYNIWDKTQYPLCDAWKLIVASTPDSNGKASSIEKIEKTLKCKLN